MDEAVPEDSAGSVFYTILALLTSGYFARKYLSVRRRLRDLNLGLEGEKVVGQHLEDLRRMGCRVFHDITGEGFNIDHVVVSPTGIYSIETKTYRKPVEGDAQVEFDGEKILVGGFEPDRNAIVQVRASSRWLQDMLSESTGRKFPVRGVVVLPGWFVKRTTAVKTDVWVLNHKALPSFMEHEQACLSPEDVALVSSRISVYMQDR